MASVFMLVGVFGPVWTSVAAEYQGVTKSAEWMRKPPDLVKAPAIIFIRGKMEEPNTKYTRRYYYETDPPYLLALYLTPDMNDKLVKMYPNRNVYTMTFDSEKRSGTINPGLDNAITARNYYYAGINFRYSDRDETRAINTYLRGLEITPDDPDTILQSGRAYMDASHFDKAIPFLDKLSNNPTYKETSLLAKGICLGEMGRKSDAASLFSNLAATASNPEIADMAQKWVRHYSGGSAH